MNKKIRIGDVFYQLAVQKQIYVFIIPVLLPSTGETTFTIECECIKYNGKDFDKPMAYEVPQVYHTQYDEACWAALNVIKRVGWMSDVEMYGFVNSLAEPGENSQHERR